MQYSIFVKFLVIILCTLSLVACMAGGAGILIDESQGMYTKGLEQWIKGELTGIGHSIAYESAVLYAAEHLGDCPEQVLDTFRDTYYMDLEKMNGSYAVEIYQNGVLLTPAAEIPNGSRLVEFTMSVIYPAIWTGEVKEDAVFHNRESIFLSTPLGDTYEVDLARYESPAYHIRAYLQMDLLDPFQLQFMELMYAMRYVFIVMLVAGLLSFAATLVYLCHAAGRHPKSRHPYPAALNRVPLDLYFAIVIAGEVGLSYLVLEILEACFNYGGNWGIGSLVGLGVFGMALLAVGFLFALAAQMKTKGGFWWRRTIIGWFLVRLWRSIRLLFRGVGAICNMLPLVWQWLLMLLGVIGWGGISLIVVVSTYSDFWGVLGGLGVILSVLGFVGLVAYWAYCMGHLLKGVLRMSRGGLHYQIPTRYLRGKFREFAEALNSMAGAARIAAERQLKSERMKTELITNVSHDIKTPLTSIINYVDLLKKPHDEAQGAQYLEVLDRQSQRLKKLIEDLMEMSKASTGNIHVDMDCVDAVEAVNQALGEFSDKLDRAGLFPVFRCPEEPVLIQADGKLLWRILSNLLNNAVKYAMPGTRFYIDLVEVRGNAVLNLKNISREQLNINAEELLERFVRGDTARNTEGSGLGLNIAKSLVELQGGQMELMVDGDLFKVTIVFPLTRM